MKFRKNGADVIGLSPDGDIIFGSRPLASFCEEENLAVPAAGSGALQIGLTGAAPMLATRDVATPIRTVTDATLRGRFSTRAVFPDATARCLRFNAPDGTTVAALTRDGDLLVRGQDCTELPNPGTNGTYTFDRVVYAAPGLAYPVGLVGEYGLFQNPSVNYGTGTIDLSGVFPNVSDPVPGNVAYQWPFNIHNVPINGLIRVPLAPGPFPLIVFAHGNHTPLENSTPGYLYLCDLLATHGIIAATIDVNFFNGQIYGENAARALLQLEHIKQFRTWNTTAGHPLAGKVDLSRIVIVGHSRGGEAVGHASLFNRMDTLVPTPGAAPVALDGTGQLGPYHFQLRAATAIAPTDDQYEPVNPAPPPAEHSTVIDETSYFLIHGTMDADVVQFPGYRAYDRALPYDPNQMLAPASGFKSLLWVYNANHNYFNTAWGYDGGQDPQAGSPPGLMLPDLQRTIAKVFLGAWAQIHLLARSSYWRLFRGPQYATQRNWIMDPVTLVSQYHDKERLWLQTFDEAALQLTPPVTGSLQYPPGVTREYLARPNPAPPPSDDPQWYLYEETGGLHVQWTAASQNLPYRVYDLGFPADSTNRFQLLSLRVGQSPEPRNAVNADQDFTIQVSDGTNTFSSPASAWATLPYPGPLSTPPVNDPAYPPYLQGYSLKMVMQTIRIPLSALEQQGVNVRAIESVAFLFNRVNKGVLYFDDLQLSL